MMTFGSLFSGVGGLDLGFERAGCTIRWQVEIDPFAVAVLEKHWPHVRRHGDITTTDAAQLEPVDIICGGFPCQDISYAGDGAGIDGERSGLWGEMWRIVRDLRPRYVVVENVAALLTRGIGRVLGDLARIGYDAEWSCVSACSVGAPHMRRRVFIVAYPNGEHGRAGLRYSDASAIGSLQTVHGFAGARASWQARLANPSELYRGADGVSRGLDRNHGIGNAVAPQVAEWIARRIIEAEVAH